ncbi:glycosyltransferase family 39 protein [Candidatus Woesearchaeota archaeon]|nr:glycosyltransferase family 39 protein [Candidatus Woesearchaeota archaeon]
MTDNDSQDNLQQKRTELTKKVKSFFSTSDDAGDALSQKRKKVITYLKENKNLWVYVVLIAIILLGGYIRTLNFSLLHDVTNQEWLSVDLDSHIYFKYAKMIMTDGSVPAVDTTRFVPIGAPTANYAFMAYVIYFLYKIMHFLVPTVTLGYADVVYPVIAFALGIFFFFLLARRLFNEKVALLGSFLLTISPAFLQRTMGGSSDHDALGMMFMFLSMYLFIAAWQAKDLKRTLWWGAAAGVATGLTGLTWGAWKFLALIFGLFVLLEYIFQKIERRHVYMYGLWFVIAVLVMVSWVPLFPLSSLVKSITTAIPLFILVVLAIDLVLFQYHLFGLETKIKGKIPPAAVSILVAGALGLLGLLIAIGPMHLGSQLEEAKSLLLHPMGKDRWELTVAEQHQPYFTDILSNFGPEFVGVPAAYFLFLIGTILAFYAMVRKNKDKVKLVLAYVLFLFFLLWSRYSPDGVLNGSTPLSIILYFGSFLALAVLTVYYVLRGYYKDREAYEQLKSWDSNLLFVLIWVLFMVVAARGAIRLLFVFAPVVALLGAYAVVELAKMIWNWKHKSGRVALLVVLLLVLMSPLVSPFRGLIPDNYQDSVKQATYTSPPYNPPWQMAGAWVRENIAKDAVFAHWWDYGYWVQNGFERASVLDGANKVKYWNYLMGRYVLTGQSQEEALQFLSVHRATNLLIVSDDIGKYTAYSSIGSDENYDRYSWINTFVLNEKGTQETRDSTVLMFQGSQAFDDDFTWNGEVFPARQSGVGAVFVPIRRVVENETTESVTFGQPTIAIVKDGKRTDVPLQCLYFNGKMFRYQTQGYAGCFRIIPVLANDGKIASAVGAGLFVSEEGMKALWVNLYVFDQQNLAYDTSAFREIYGVGKSGIPLSLYQNRLIGPIKMWEINYPKGFTVDPEMKKRYLGGNEYLPEYFFKVN